MRTAKTMIRLGGCPGCSESSLGAHATLLVLSWCSSFAFFLHKDICCGYSLKSPCIQMSTHNICFFTENGRKLSFNYHQIPFYILMLVFRSCWTYIAYCIFVVITLLLIEVNKILFTLNTLLRAKTSGGRLRLINCVDHECPGWSEFSQSTGHFVGFVMLQYNYYILGANGCCSKC